jgi:hypothetical protein
MVPAWLGAGPDRGPDRVAGMPRGWRCGSGEAGVVDLRVLGAQPPGVSAAVASAVVSGGRARSESAPCPT